MNIAEWLATIVVLLSAFLAALTGFGFVILSAPLLSFFYHPAQTVYIALALGTLLLGLLLATTDMRRVMRRDLVARLCLWSLPGLPLGLWIIPHLDAGQFRLGMGCITLGFVAFRLWGGSARLGNPAVSVALAGILGGAFSTSTGMNALPVIFLAGDMEMDAFEQRATLAGYVFITSLASLAAFHWTGAVESVPWASILVLLPALLVGLVAGAKLVKRLSATQLTTGVLCYLAVNGAIAVLAGLYPTPF